MGISLVADTHKKEILLYARHTNEQTKALIPAKTIRRNKTGQHLCE
jgi:hypothetical protein